MTAPTATRLSARSIPVRIGDAMTVIAGTLHESSDLSRCSREAERIFALSDDELARRGLTRDRIIQHASGATSTADRGSVRAASRAAPKAAPTTTGVGERLPAIPSSDFI
jgi:hypothetical protein